MRVYIIALFFFTSFIPILLKSSEIDDSVFVKSGQLRIVKKNFFYEIPIFGKYIISDKHLSFCPRSRHDKKFINEISISIDSIVKITKVPLNSLLIEVNNGCQYKVIVGKKREFIRRAGGLISKSQDNRYIETPKDYNVDMRINCLGTTVYSPLNVKGVIDVEKPLLTFTPTELSCYIKKIQINKNEIKKVRERGRRRFIIKLYSGERYVFASHTREQLLYILGLK